MADEVLNSFEQFQQTVQSCTSLGATFPVDVQGLLEALGYTLQTADGWLLGYIAQSVEWEIKSACNVSSVPEGLRQAAVKMTVGEFLNSKKGAGQLEGLALNIDPIVKQVQEGDTNVVYAMGQGMAQTPEQQLSALIALLMTSGKRMFATYRRLTW